MKLKFKLLAILVGAAVALPSLAEITYTKDVAKIIKARCSECHSAEAGSPNLQEFLKNVDKFAKKDKVGPRYDTYEHLLMVIAYPDPGAFMRRLDDGSNKEDKKPGNMYEKLGDTPAERAANLAIIKEWVGPGAWNFNHWEADPKLPAITKEQMNKIKALY